MCCREALERAGLEVVSCVRVRGAAREYVLARAAPPAAAEEVVVDVSDDAGFAWVEPLRAALARAERSDCSVRVLAVARGATGALGLAACLRAEPGGAALRLYCLPADAAFAPHAAPYAAQLRRDLAVNVLRAGVWGSYRHLETSSHHRDAMLQVSPPFKSICSSETFNDYHPRCRIKN